MTNRCRSRWMALSLAFGLTLTILGLSKPAKAQNIENTPNRIRSNSIFPQPNNITMADLKGDGLASWIIFDGDKIFATETTFEAHGQFYAKLPANVHRVITGRFGSKTKDNLCAVLKDNSFQCYGMSPDTRALWWAFTQANFLSDDEQILSGDFDGDGFDEILAFNSGTGVFRMFKVEANGFFAEDPKFTLGNLSNASQFRGAYALAARLGYTAGEGLRDGLIMVLPGSGQIMRYESVTTAGGGLTFYWSFTTNPGIFASGEQVTTANLEDTYADDLVVHNVNSGTNRFYRLDYNSGNLVRLPDTVARQIATIADSYLYWGKFNITSEPGTHYRHDAMVYDIKHKMMNRYDARHDAQKNDFTYYWAYTQFALDLDADQDGDGLTTRWELGGLDEKNDGTSTVPLHEYGASPFIKDVFVEVDYMAAGPGEKQSHEFQNEAVQLALNSMAAKGINLHVFVDQEIPYEKNLGNPSFDWSKDFDPIKKKYFTSTRWSTFHYCVFGASYNGGTSSGISRGIGASDFLVTLGGWSSNPGTTDQQAGTFLHELGHNLGLQHGGVDGTNFKPNFLSIMNYSYQTVGVSFNGTRDFFYSTTPCSDVNESSLSESTGVRCSEQKGIAFQAWIASASKWCAVNTSCDFNNNGKIDPSSDQVDLNSADDSSGKPIYQVLKGGPNEYAILKFKVGSIGQTNVLADSVPLFSAPPEQELDHETYVRLVKPMEATLPVLAIPKKRVIPEYQPMKRKSVSNDPGEMGPIVPKEL